MNKEKINKILEDIFLIDPKLKSKERELYLIIEKVIESKPEVEINKQFIDDLKVKLLNQADNLESGHNIFKYWPKFVFSATLVLAIYLVATFALPSYLSLFTQPEEDYDSSIILALDKNAFGSLEFNVSERVEGLGMSEESLIGAQDIGLLPIPEYEQKNYKYVYNGDFFEDFDMSDISNLVYKRSSDNLLARQLAANFSSLRGLPLDFNKFNQKEISNISFVENKEFGYLINLDLNSNNISITQNWQKWPRPYENCYDQNCLDSIKLTLNDFLSEEDFLKIANNFVKNYNIELINYTKAELGDSLRFDLENPKNDPNFYLPEHVNIVFPLELNNNLVYDEWGNKYGLNISINVREKRVSSMSNYNFSQFKSSPYELVNDLDKINKLLERGGLHYDYYNNNLEDSDLIEIELSEPKIVLIRTWQIDQENRFNYEIFMPCLVFNVTEKPNNYFHRNQVIIPLVDEVLNKVVSEMENINKWENERIIPLPYIEDDRDSAVIDLIR